MKSIKEINDRINAKNKNLVLIAEMVYLILDSLFENTKKENENELNLNTEIDLRDQFLLTENPYGFYSNVFRINYIQDIKDKIKYYLESKDFHYNNDLDLVNLLQKSTVEDTFEYNMPDQFQKYIIVTKQDNRVKFFLELKEPKVYIALFDFNLYDSVNSTIKDLENILFFKDKYNVTFNDFFEELINMLLNTNSDNNDGGSEYLNYFKNTSKSRQESIFRYFKRLSKDPISKSDLKSIMTFMLGTLAKGFI